MVGPVKGYPGLSIFHGVFQQLATRGVGNTTMDESDIRGLVTGMRGNSSGAALLYGRAFGSVLQQEFMHKGASRILL